MELKNLSFRYPYAKENVFQDLNYRFEERKTNVLLMESQSGKTTLCHLLVSQLRPTDGQVFLNGESCTAKEMRCRNVGVLMQDFALLPKGTVRQNVEYPLKVRNLPTDRVREVLYSFGLEKAENTPVKMLSDEQRLATALARLSVRRLDLFVADDVWYLPGETVRGLLQTFLQRQSGATAILLMQQPYWDAGRYSVFRVGKISSVSAEEAQEICSDERWNLAEKIEEELAGQARRNRK